LAYAIIINISKKEKLMQLAIFIISEFLNLMKVHR